MRIWKVSLSELALFGAFASAESLWNCLVFDQTTGDLALRILNVWRIRTPGRESAAEDDLVVNGFVLSLRRSYQNHGPIQAESAFSCPKTAIPLE